MAQADIEKRLQLLEKSQNQLKTLKDMVADALANDGELIELEDKAKEARRRYTAAKEALMNEPEQAKMQEQIKELNAEIKDIRKLLGDELLAYFMKNNSLEYVDTQGITRKIAVSAKFVSGKPEQD